MELTSHMNNDTNTLTIYLFIYIIIYVIKYVVDVVSQMNKKIYAKLVFPRAKIDGNFTLDISGDAVVQELAIDAQADVCSTEKEYWRLFVIE